MSSLASRSLLRVTDSMHATRIATFVASVLALSVAVVGCGSTPHGSTLPNAATFRERAASRPDDPDAALALAEAELFVDGGDTQRAHDAIARAEALDPGSVRASFLHGIEADLHGRHAEALTSYLETLRLAASSRDPWAPAIAEVAVASAVEYDDAVPGFVTSVEPVFRALFDAPGAIGPKARFAIGNVLVDFAYRRGDLAAVHTLVGAQRCLAEARVAGPFGPRQLLDFDRALAPEEPGPLAASYDYGFARGVRDTRDVEARGCALHLGSGPVGGPGTTYAEGTFEVASAGTYTIRLETPNAVELFVDDRSVARLDRRVDPSGRVSFHAVTLGAGPHRVMAKVSTRHPNPVLILTLLDGDATSDVALDAPSLRAEHPLALYLDVTRSMARSDWVGARERLGEIDVDSAPTTLLVLATGVAFGDPLRAQQVARDDANRFVTAASVRDPEVWYPALQRARFEAENGRVREALALLRDGTHHFPDAIVFPMTLVELLQARGWNDQVEPILAALSARVPDACRPRRASLARAVERGRMPEARRLSEELVQCDARSDARLARLLRERRFDEATAELHRLAALEPRSTRFQVLDSELTLARARGDQPRIDALLRELATLMPQSQNVVLAEVDRLLARGDEQAAHERLVRALRSEPESMTDLRRLARAVFHDSPLESYRRDGREIVRAFEASGRTYENAPQVLVWDYTVTRLLTDGTVLELTHQIYRAQSEEAVDDLGQFQAPGDALLLTLRTLEPDGTAVEPDQIAGLEHIEMPALDVGDYVESEYVRVKPPEVAFQGGALGDRFFFQSFEIPFDTSQLTLVVPSGTDVRIDPRGEAPTTERRTEGDTEVFHWEVHESQPLRPEPGSVHMREFLPSIAWGVRATWPELVESFDDLLADRDVRDPAAVRLVHQLEGEPGSSVEQRAERIYHWLLENIEDSSDVFGQAAPMLSARTGSRSRLFVYLLRLAGIHADLALVRSYAFDSTESELPDDETYGDLAIRVQGTTGPFWVETGLRHSAFGTLSPLVRGQDALILGGAFEHARVPLPSPEVDLRTIEVDLTLDASGNARAVVDETYRGVAAATWRNQLESVPAAELESAFEENYVSRLLPGARMRSLRITGRENPEQALHFRYEIEVTDLGRIEGGVRLVPTLFPSSLTASLARLATRTRTQVVPWLASDVRVTFHVPPGTTIDAPEDRTFDGPDGMQIRSQSEHTADGLILTRSVRVHRTRVAPAAYPAFAAVCREVDEHEQREVRIHE